MNIKTILFAGMFAFLNIKVNFLPNTDLLVMMGLAMTFDLITGVAKSYAMGVKRTSKGYRQTIIKFLQYGGAILVSMGITFLGQYNPEMKKLSDSMAYFNNGLLVFIIFIELTSILENCYEMNKTSKISQFLIRPILKLFTFELKNNPIAKLENNTNESN